MTRIQVCCDPNPVCVCSGANHESVEPAMLEVRKPIHTLDLIVYFALLTISHRLPLPAWRQHNSNTNFNDLSQCTTPVCMQPTEPVVPAVDYGKHD